MRSRYSSYALGGHGDYLLRTWFPATAQNLSVVELSKRSCDWFKLDVLDKSQTGDAGIVEFRAHFHDTAGVANVLHEKSVFARVSGTWFYVGGEVET